MRNDFKYFAVLSIILTAAVGYVWHSFLWAYVVLIPLVLMGVYDMFQTQHALKRTFPFVHWKPYMDEANPLDFTKTFQDITL